MIFSDDSIRPFMEWALEAALPENAKFIGREVNGELVGAFGFVNYTGDGGDIEVLVAGNRPGWLSLPLMRAVWKYVWDVCGCRRASARVRVSNTKQLEYMERWGFQREGLMREAYCGNGKTVEDMVVFGILRSERKHG